MSIIYEDRMFKETKNETTYNVDAFPYDARECL